MFIYFSVPCGFDNKNKVDKHRWWARQENQNLSRLEEKSKVDVYKNCNTSITSYQKSKTGVSVAPPKGFMFQNLKKITS